MFLTPFCVHAMHKNPNETKAVNVVVSIAPLHSWVCAIMEGVATPQLLLDASQSPHSATMKPSMQKMMAEADMLIWVGPSLESFLIKPILTYQTSNCQLSGMEKFPFKKPRFDHVHKGDCDHYHAVIDPHVWLDLEHAPMIVDEITFYLCAFDIENAPIFKANARKLKERLVKLKDQIVQKASQIHKGAGKMTYVSFHDAYQYLEGILPIENTGILSSGEGGSLSLAQIDQLSKDIVNKKVCCIFQEPQMKFPVAQKITDKNHLCMGTLDPLGMNIAPGPDHFFKMMDQIIIGLTSCGKKNELQFLKP